MYYTVQAIIERASVRARNDTPSNPVPMFGQGPTCWIGGRGLRDNASWRTRQAYRPDIAGRDCDYALQDVGVRLDSRTGYNSPPVSIPTFGQSLTPGAVRVGSHCPELGGTGNICYAVKAIN
jgi:hypothetical protein